MESWLVSAIRPYGMIIQVVAVLPLERGGSSMGSSRRGRVVCSSCCRSCSCSGGSRWGGSGGGRSGSVLVAEFAI